MRKGKRKPQGVKTKARSGLRLGAMKGVFETVARDFDQPLSAAEISKLLGASDKEELDGPFDGDVGLAWRDEVQRRSRKIDAGAVRCIPADEVFARIDDQLKE